MTKRSAQATWKASLTRPRRKRARTVRYAAQNGSARWGLDQKGNGHQNRQNLPTTTTHHLHPLLLLATTTYYLHLSVSFPLAPNLSNQH